MDDVHWDHDAKYFYYAHGPLARTEYGHWKNQGTDYAYTVQGWIKGVNSDMLNVEKDMGFDGWTDNTNVNKYTGADAYGYSLGYFTNDYESINSTDFLASRSAATYLSTYGKNLYNGNIGHMITTLPDGIDVDVADRQMGTYLYDQLNRIVHAKYWQENSFTGDDLNGGSSSNKYLERYKYDGNGNILNLQRWDGSGVMQDDMTYAYYEKTTSTQRDGFGSGYYTNDMSNRLGYVNDAVVGLTPGDDIESGMISGNYTYDEIGQLLSDAQEEIEEIKWTVKNKVHKVIRTNASTKDDLEFVYDAMGNRVCKIVKPDGTSVENGGTDQPANWDYTYYNLDAQGNTIEVYTIDATDDNLMLSEQYIYGSDRVGVLNRNVDMSGSVSTSNIYDHTLGKKAFELKNHLGNVLVTISDMPFAMDDSGSDNITDAFEPQVMTVQDYTPFGALLDGRQTSATDSKYGFNGMRKDDELKGSGNSYDYGFRMYDSRVSRFFNVDYITAKYPELTPYQFASNMPINSIDQDGLESAMFIVPRDENGKSLMSDKDFDDFRHGMSNSAGKALGATVIIGKTIGLTLITLAQPQIGIPLIVADVTKAPVVLPALGAIEGSLATGAQELATTEKVAQELASTEKAAQELTEGVAASKNATGTLDDAANISKQATKSAQAVSNKASSTSPPKFELILQNNAIEGAGILRGKVYSSGTTLQAEISMIFKAPAYKGKVFGNMVSLFEKNAKDLGLSSAKVDFKYVSDYNLGMYESQAKKYGYSYSAKDAGDGTYTVTWSKKIE